jgi:hypothetical protein
VTRASFAAAGLIPPGQRPALGGLVDRGAVTAAYVGLGMAIVIAISFLLIIPIEPVYTAFALPAGLLLGYYAGVRSARTRGAWLRFLGNALFVGAVTGITLAALLLGVKALFFYADSGYPDYNRTDPNTGAVIPPTCQTGADCVYQRYRTAQPDDLQAAGVTDATSFATVYWSQQTGTAGILLGISLVAAVAGGAIFGATRPRASLAPAAPATNGAGAAATVTLEPEIAAATPAERAEPETEDGPLGELAEMFFDFDQEPTPGRELLDPAKLDFSLISLGHVDDYLDKVRTRELSDRDRGLVVLRAGAYVGEVIRRQSESRTYHWLGREEAIRVRPSIATMAGPVIGTMAVLWAEDKVVFPLAKVSKFLENGRDDSVQFFAATTARL